MSEKRRMLLKLSGGVLAPEGGMGIGPTEIGRIAREISDGFREADGRLDLAIVIGGGNFLRGREVSSQRIARVTADHMGMLATIMNSLALQSALESLGHATRVLSAIAIDAMVEQFIQRKALYHLAQGRIIICAGGTGLPFFSTDSTAVLRALEIEADKLLKGTRVRGVFSANPEQDPEAEFFEEITFDEVLQRDLGVADATAISLCREHRLPLEVFDMTVEGNIKRAIHGERLGTLIRA